MHKYVIGLAITLLLGANTAYAADYKVQPGDSLWIISQRYKISIEQIIKQNSLSSDKLQVGQVLKLNQPVNQGIPSKTATLTQVSSTSWLPMTTAQPVQQVPTESSYRPNTYTVLPGDFPYAIATKFNITVDQLKQLNNLTSDLIYPGQTLIVSNSNVSRGLVASRSGENTTQTESNNKEIEDWPEKTYIVQEGDTFATIAQKFNIPLAKLLEYNYRNVNDPLISGDKLAISDYAPREYTVKEGEDAYPERYGTAVDWFKEGRYILPIGAKFIVTDTETGKQFQMVRFGGVNHLDVETQTLEDTNIMKELFGEWKWDPRPVTVFYKGMNIAASLSGMPHTTLENIKDNGITGHQDLYFKNSLPHGAGTSQSYVNQHYAAIKKAEK